ncbi:hypothetical protein ACFWMG_22955, partial [Streptomyces sp. NPDC127074]
MIWWFKARAVPALSASVVGTNVVGLLMGNAELPVPVLTGQSGHFLVGHLITLLPAVMLLHGMGRGGRRGPVGAGPAPAGGVAPQSGGGAPPRAGEVAP